MEPGRLLPLAVLVLVAAAPVSVSRAEPLMLDPRSMGFDVPPGEVLAGGTRRVLTDDQQGRPVVGRLYIQIGAFRIVLLPDGELVARAEADAPDTDRAFEPATQKAMQQRLREELGPEFQLKATRHYVYAYNCSDEFAMAASRILETMRPGVQSYMRRIGIETTDPELPLIAVMFRTEAEFQTYRRMPDGVVAYYDTLTNRIVMFEESPLFRVKRELAVQQAISTIAHEGAHQILHNVGVQRRLSSWPMWLGEGLAEYFAPTTFGRRMHWKGVGQINDLRMLELEVYLKGRTADAIDGQMVDHTVSAARLTSTGYAAAWSLTHFLAERRRSAFSDFVREVSQLGPFETAGAVEEPGVVPANAALFQKHFGSDFAELEADLVTHLKKQPYRDPFAEFPHFVATIAVIDGRREIRDANVFHTPQLATNWINESLRRLPVDQRSTAQTGIVEVRNRPSAEQAARQFIGR